MTTYSIIQKSQLEGAHRIDAEYYQPEYRNNEKVISSFGYRTFGEISKIAYGTTPPNASFVDSGIPFVRSQNLSLLTVDESALVFCDEEFHQENEKSAIRPKDILFAAVGATIGQLAIIQNSLEEGNINQNIARVRITSEEVNPIFAGLFFASRIGQLQISRLVTGNAQAYLNTDQIKSFKIPIISRNKQLEIVKYFDKIQNEISTANFLYSQAENLLLQKLGLKDFKSQEDLSCVVNFSDIKSAHRADAEYWQPKYKKLLSYLKKKFKIKRLGDLVNIKKGVEPGSERYQEEGKLFIRVSNISKHGIVGKDQKYLTDDFYQELKRNYQPKIGEVLLTKDATPGIAYVIKEPIEGVIAGGILRLKVEIDLESEYLALIINSPIGQCQMERDTGGSVIIHWRPEQIKDCLIPILPKSTQQKIADLVCESHKARKKAKKLLEEAKQKVEKIILKDR
ncbi:restriction endonuclease subunit S [bacterium]|nr:restriction endonuclease subunit S [bacterium]